MQLNFIQSNWLRQYPFRANNGTWDLYNNQLSCDLIVAMRITCTAADLDVYINKVTINQGIVSISVSGTLGPIGAANGLITSDNQSLLITNFKGGTIGSITIGNAASAQITQSYLFNNTNGLIEPSTIMVLPPPSVTSLTIKGTAVVGNITLTSNTVNISTGSSLNLSVIYPTTVTSRNDKCASFLTCDNPVIGGINSVMPDVTGNINLFAIEPLILTTSTVDGVVQIQLSSPSTDLSSLCKLLNIPPTDTSSTSYEPINTITNPEWSSWSQYNS